MESSWFAIAGLAAAGLGVMPLLLLALAIPYAIVRLRTDGTPDTQLGLKVALYFFISASIVLALTGATMIVADWMAHDSAAPKAAGEIVFEREAFGGLTSNGFNAVRRAGLALLISGIVGWIAHHLMLKRTTPANQARVQRTFLGVRFAITGLAFFGAITLLLVLLLQEKPLERPNLNAVRGVIGVLLIWGPAWLLHLAVFLQAARATPRDGAETFDPYKRRLSAATKPTPASEPTPVAEPPSA